MKAALFALTLLLCEGRGKCNRREALGGNEPGLEAEALGKSDVINDFNSKLSRRPYAYSAIEIHDVLVTIEVPQSTKPNTKRHINERNHLLKQMSRKYGSWNAQHPRHRLLDALFGFKRYAQSQRAELNRLKGLYSHVTKKQKSVLERATQYSQKFAAIERRLTANQLVCNSIVQNALRFYEIEEDELDQHIRQKDAAGQPTDRTSVSQALKHFVRDWATAGERERDAAYPCILKILVQLFPNRETDGARVLLPGAGLGRLGHEVAKLYGFEVTNNEWSMYQNVAYRFLEYHSRREEHMIHPFVDSWSHHITTTDMLRGISFPHTSLNSSSVVLVEGDFTTVFKDSSSAFDAVVTHFFIDTARNLMSYFETIHRILRPGGFWINFGPLLYGTGPFVQLSLDEIVTVVESMGFEFVEVPEQCGQVTLPKWHIRGVEAVYGFDEKALTKNAYNAQIWVARKKM